MAANGNSLVVDKNTHGLEYYEEVDHSTLDFLNRNQRSRKAPAKPIREVIQIVDPVQELNKQLNRQYRPDLAVSTPESSSESPVSLQSVPQTPIPNPVVFDARVKPAKLSEENKEPSISLKRHLRDRIHQITAPTPILSEEFNQENLVNTNEIPRAGVTRIPAFEKQMSKHDRSSKYPPPHPIVSDYQPPTVNYNNSIKMNRVAPPPPIQTDYTVKNYDQNRSHKLVQQSSSYISSNPQFQSKSMAYQKPIQNSIDRSKPDKRKSKKTTGQDATNTNRSYALYNQQNGRIEGIVKNQLNVASDDALGSQIVDDNTATKSKLALWLSQPLCLGLTRLTGGLLFGSMIILGIGSFAGLIASIATYSIDNVNDAQWKILGMVVCSIMLITIIVTLIVFICCYKYGYMFNKDEDMDVDDPSAAYDAEGNERQKAVLRKIYKFNRPVDTSSIPSGRLQDVSTTDSVANQVVEVNDKQTNTESTIAVVRPKDIERGVWASRNAFGGIVYRPLVQPTMVSRIVQVLPEDFELMQPTQIMYQVVVPQTAEIQSRYVEVPVQQPSYVEVIETKSKPSRTLQQASMVERTEAKSKLTRVIQEAPVVEMIETKPSQPRATIVRPPQTQHIVVQQSVKPRYEYVEVDEDSTVLRKGRPQYEIVEETTDESDDASVEEIVEIVDAPKHLQQQQKSKKKIKETRKGFGNVLVKHVKSNNDEPYMVVRDYPS
ncbi:unnamed protein product [Adineta ricciae]|uniref:Uncharacterized protein n=1 Tax=Adineta ricciae TaxID=249248 RepID=A0A813YFE6_ADIRI|nr:unnamed protein product [Adineta ricciae]CAF1127481.1 unnamed protein product [Adineta ricciae]